MQFFRLRSIISVLLLTSALFLGTLILGACNRPDAPQASPDSSGGDAVGDAAVTETMQAVATIVQQTLDALAQPQAESPSETPNPPEAEPANPEPAAETATITLTPTLTPTSTPETPMALVNLGTNCRTGPGTAFDLSYPAPEGVLLEITANTEVPDYVIVKIPDQSGKTCWLWTQYVEIQGDLSGLPIATPPPTPTPTLTPTPSAAFTLAFALMDGCVGWDPGFTVFNTGGMTFRSYQVVVTDTTTDITITSNANLFDQRNGCAIAVANPTLEPSETGYVYASSYLYDPAGHTMNATVTLCTEADLNGTCTSQTVNFTP